MAYQTILVERRSRLAVVTLNRPEKLNVLSLMMKAEIATALRELDADPEVRVILLTGAGERAFTAGADIAEFAGRTAVEQQRMYEAGTVYDAVEAVGAPLIAMVNGVCLGGGLELAMACDIRIASERAVFGQTEVNLGLIPGGGGSQRLPRLVGLGAALKLALSGDHIAARDALRLGLVDEVVPHAELMPRTSALAETIASKSAVAVRRAKAAIKASARLPLSAGLQYERALFLETIATEDKEEGVRAFLQKREPAWRDR